MRHPTDPYQIGTIKLAQLMTRHPAALAAGCLVRAAMPLKAMVCGNAWNSDCEYCLSGLRMYFCEAPGHPVNRAAKQSDRTAARRRGGPDLPSNCEAYRTAARQRSESASSRKSGESAASIQRGGLSRIQAARRIGESQTAKRIHSTANMHIRRVKEEHTMEYVTLNTGAKMLLEGFGVYQIPDAKQCE